MPLYLDDQAHAASVAPDVQRGTVAVVGNFDGVHRGHQVLFERAADLARERGLVPVALTFDPHPSVVLGRSAPGALTTMTRKVELITGLGAAHVFVRRFDLAFAAWPPDRFVEELVARELYARAVVCGKNFRFGRNRSGDAEVLRVMGERLGFEAFAAEATDEKGPLSSTRARDAIAAGDLTEAERILGRRHAIEGEVVRGDGRGRTIGFPTANIAATVLLPANGVYAVVVDRVTRAGALPLGPGVMNIGVRPTVGEQRQRTAEVNLFGFDRDLYGETLRAHLVKRLRDERRFESLDALKAQIAVDASEARSAIAHLAGMGNISPP